MPLKQRVRVTVCPNDSVERAERDFAERQTVHHTADNKTHVEFERVRAADDR